MDFKAAPMIWVLYTKESGPSYPMPVIYLQEVIKLIQNVIFKKWVKNSLIKSKDT